MRVFFKIIVFLFFGTEFETIRKQTNANGKSPSEEKKGGGVKSDIVHPNFFNVISQNPFA